MNGAMIHCPKCGAANRRGSRFCNECGEPLPMRTALRCPMCGAMNPIGNVYCDKCNARLVPMAARPFEESDHKPAPIKGLSLPTIPLEEQEEQPVESAPVDREPEQQQTEDWLMQLRASAVPEAEEPEPAPEPVEPVEIPDWLRDMGPMDIQPSEEQARGRRQEAESTEPSAPAPAEVPEWRQQLTPPEFPAAEVEAPAPAPAEIPEWQQQLTPPEFPAPEAETEAPAPAPAEVPEWLQELAPSEAPSPAAEAPAPAPSEVAGWEQQLAPPEFPAPEAEAPAPAPAEIPEWLQELATSEVPSPGAEAPAPTPAEVTGWEQQPTPPELPAAETEAPAPAPAEIPEWLQELAPSEAPSPAAEAPAPTPAEVAGWEQQPTPPELPVAEAEAPAPAPAEIPEWLQELAPSEAPSPAAEAPAPTLAEVAGWEQQPTPPELPVAEAEAPAPAPAEIPEWLQELAPSEAPSPAAEAPAPTLAEVAGWEQQPTPPELPAPEARAPAPAPAEMPEWLQEMAPSEAPLPAAEASAPTPAEVAGWEQQPTPPELPAPEAGAPAPAPADIPEWLQELAPSEAPSPGVEAPAPALADVPEWLQEPAVEAREWAEKPTLPESAPAEARGPFVQSAPEEAIPLAAAETSDWLREREPGEGAVPEGEPDWLSEIEAVPVQPAAAAVPVFEEMRAPEQPEPPFEMAEAAGLARAEIPDWLEALRPRTEPGAAAIQEEAVETEGLLEGLRGAIAPALPLEAPVFRESARPAEISEASRARAELLQGLITQPIEVPQPAAGEREVSVAGRVQRLLVAIVLIAAVAGPLVLPTMGVDVPTLTQPATSPEAQGRIEFKRLERAFDVIQDVDAGEAVVVAFEYGPAEADELDVVAEPMLRHILDQGAEIAAVSTRPEGKRVAESLLGDIIASEAQYTETQLKSSSYRPGNAIGVSQLLANAGPYRFILVLTAQPGSLRHWVEQTEVRGEDASPLIAGLSAALEPAATPYLDATAGQLEGSISGLSGAAAYETLRGSPGHAAQRIDALAAGHAAIAGLMMLGAVFHALRNPRGRKK